MPGDSAAVFDGRSYNYFFSSPASVGFARPWRSVVASGRSGLKSEKVIQFASPVAETTAILHKVGGACMLVNDSTPCEVTGQMAVVKFLHDCIMPKAQAMISEIPDGPHQAAGMVE